MINALSYWQFRAILTASRQKPPLTGQRAPLLHRDGSKSGVLDSNAFCKCCYAWHVHPMIILPIVHIFTVVQWMKMNNKWWFYHSSLIFWPSNQLLVHIGQTHCANMIILAQKQAIPIINGLCKLIFSENQPMKVMFLCHYYGKKDKSIIGTKADTPLGQPVQLPRGLIGKGALLP